MPPTHLHTVRLELVPLTRDELLKQIPEMPAEQRAEISPVWLARLNASAPVDPWVHGFLITDRATGKTVGRCGFKGPPDTDGIVEIAYGIDAEHQGKGYATEAARALVEFAFDDSRIRLVRAHTLPQPNASTHVLTKCGFHHMGDVIDPEDGPVWRWEIPKHQA
jgi:RimJ/RimL family protein N-acetyltransferase